MHQNDHSDDDPLSCLAKNKSAVLATAGLSFVAGCLVTGLSLGLGFAFYLRSQDRENYQAYELEMADETLHSLDDEVDHDQPEPPE